MKFRAEHTYKPSDDGTYVYVNMYRVRVTLLLSEAQAKELGNRDIDVTLEPVQTPEERLREARLKAFEARNQGMLRALTALEAVEVIERVDAEFAKGEK